MENPDNETTVLHVLLVEDNPGDTLYIQELLDEFGTRLFSVSCCTTLAETLGVLQRTSPDVVLLDLNLPDSSGLDTLDEILARRAELPIVVLTGLSDNELGQQAIHRGAQDYLVKNEIEAPLLIRSISYGVERKQAEENLRALNAELEDRVRERTADLARTVEEREEEIRERRRAEGALAAEKEHLRVVLESIGDAVVEVCAEGTIRFANQKARRLFACEGAAETETRSLADLLEPLFDGPAALASTLIEGAHRHGGPWDYPDDLECCDHAGNHRVLRATSAPVYSDFHGMHGFVIALRDITHEREREREMQRADKLESLGLLAGGISHDFNNILTVICGNVSLAHNRCNSPEDVQELLAEVATACEQAKGLTHQLLTFAKGGEPVKKTTNVGTLVRQSARFASRGAAAKCECRFPDDLWLANIDPGQIGQVVSNLVINAVQAMPEGGEIDITANNVTVGAEDDAPLQAGRYVVLQVRDTGVGIAPRHLPRVFEPYYTTKQTGSGLGLASVYSIVRKHGGHVTVHSELGQGTTFRVYLPASDTDLTGREEGTQAHVEGRGRVLFMDDEPAIRNLAATLFRRLGYTLTLAEDGEEAVRRFREAEDAGEPFDLVIVDLTVPGGKGGLQAIKEIHKTRPDAKAIVSSGYSEDAIMADHKRYGFQAALAKPWTSRELSRAVAQTLQA